MSDAESKNVRRPKEIPLAYKLLHEKCQGNEKKTLRGEKTRFSDVCFNGAQHIDILANNAVENN